MSVAIQFTQNFLGVQPKCSQVCKFVKDFRPDLLDRHRDLMAYLIYSDHKGEYKVWFSPSLRDKIIE